MDIYKINRFFFIVLGMCLKKQFPRLGKVLITAYIFLIIDLWVPGLRAENANLDQVAALLDLFPTRDQESSLLPGQCYPVITSKKYLNSSPLPLTDVAIATSSSTLATTSPSSSAGPIGPMQTDMATADPLKKGVQFQCIYKCKTEGFDFNEIAAVSNVSIFSSQDEGRDMVCDGLVMESKSTDYGQFFLPVGLRPFWAITSTKSELRAWGKNNSTAQSEQRLQSATTAAMQTIRQIAFQYLVVTEQKERFTKAALDLLEISIQSPTGMNLLKQPIQDILVAGPVEAHLYFLYNPVDQ